MTQQVWLYVGCYTSTAPTGIHVFDASDPNGHIDARTQVDDIEDASFLAADVGRATLYAVSEVPEHGSVVAYRLSVADGSLHRIDEASSHGASPCHVSVDGRLVHVANYSSGTVATYTTRDDGGFERLLGRQQHSGSGPHPRQDGPHAHCVVSRGASMYAVDLGTDRIMRYAHQPDAGDDGLRVADETVLPPGSGPRHLTFHPDQAVAYLTCELSNRLVALDVDPSGRLHIRHSVPTLPDGFSDRSIAAEVAVHPDGHRVYVSNRGHDSIATFAIDDLDAEPVLLGHVDSGGRTPRHFAVHPAGRSLLVANEDSDAVVAFALDDNAMPHDARVVARPSRPVCLTFVEVDG